MKIMSSFILALSLFSAVAHAGREGNGGDICEDRFKQVRDNIAQWITEGGGASLQLPNGVTPAAYQAKMLDAISKAKIGCTDKAVIIQHEEKTCENTKSSAGREAITCNWKRFAANTQDDQYVLVHHEYAGLAGFEVNNQDGSQYQISNQLVSLLQDVVIKQLPVAGTTPASQIQIVGVTGASRADAVTKNMPVFRIYGGLAGLDKSACSGTGTCNTCAGQALDGNFTGCNEHAITDSTNVVIQFKATMSGYPIAFNIESSGTTSGQFPINTNGFSGTAVAAGSIATVVVPWSSICNLATGNNTCSGLMSGATINFAIGISTTPAIMTGSTSFPVTAIIVPEIDGYYFADDKNCVGSASNYCYFEVAPGVSSASIQNLSAVGGAGTQFSALRFYYAEASTNSPASVPSSEFSTITLNSAFTQMPLDPDGSGALLDDKINGLTNGKVYVFKMAHVDMAGNIGLFTSDYSSTQGQAPSAPTYAADQNCDTGVTCHIAQPHAK